MLEVICGEALILRPSPNGARDGKSLSPLTTVRCLADRGASFRIVEPSEFASYTISDVLVPVACLREQYLDCIS